MHLLITSDLHLRDKAPLCRTDKDEKWMFTQHTMLKEIVEIANTEHVEGILIAGDIFHKPKVSPRLEHMFIHEMSLSECNIYIMPGQHDLPGHSFERMDQSSYGVVHYHAELNALHNNKGILPMESYCAWEEFQSRKIHKGNITNDILCVHRLVTPIHSELPAKDAITTGELFDLLSGPKIIIAGDYHHGHEHTPNRSDHKGRSVIVPGCTNRQAVDFINYKPSVVLLDDGFISRVPLSDPVENISVEHIANRKERDERLESFISLLKETNNNTSISFEDNIETALDRLSNETEAQDLIDVVRYYMKWDDKLELEGVKGKK